MPYIDLQISKSLERTAKEQLVKELGRIITLIPGKTEAVTMIRIDDGAFLAMDGKVLEPGAFVNVKMFKNSPFEDKAAFTEALFSLLLNEYGVPSNAVYVTYNEHMEWGAGGTLK